MSGLGYGGIKRACRRPVRTFDQVLTVREIRDKSRGDCHDFTLLAMFLALFFLLFTPSSCVTQITLQENNKNII